MLKQLKLAKSIELKREELKKVEAKAEALVKRSDELKEALEEAKTEEDIKTVEVEINKIDADNVEIEKEKTKVETEIEELEVELEDIKERSAKANKDKQTRAKGEVEPMNRLQVRELLKTGEYYKRSEVVEFYEKFKNLRGVTGGELAIPEVIVSRIMDILGDYSTLYPLVDRIQVKGTARILIDTDTTPASWVEQNASLPIGDVGTLAYLDFDGFKVGKVTFVDNYLLQDSLLTLMNMFQRKLLEPLPLRLILLF